MSSIDSLPSSSSSSSPPLPYWQLNLPPHQRPPTCPLYLQNLSAKDISILSTPDDAYHVLAWPEVRAIAAANRLDLFKRLPSELHRYLAYNWRVKEEHGSVMEFILSQKLGWTRPVVAEGGKPFMNEKDVEVRCNDWPYGVDDRIVHLVVWTKFDLDDDPVTGNLTDSARREIEAYVQEKFCARVKEEDVIWFKNWKSLKSVHAVEHFHVMLYDPDPAFVREITNGDVPLSQIV